jgi:hypothetical protein
MPAEASKKQFIADRRKGAQSGGNGSAPGNGHGLFPVRQKIPVNISPDRFDKSKQTESRGYYRRRIGDLGRGTIGMNLPPRSYYSVGEIASRWDVKPAVIIGWAIENHFALSTVVQPLEAANQKIAGLVNVAAEDIFTLFRIGRCTRSVRIRRIRRSADQDWLSISNPRDGIRLSASDVLLTRQELGRFEAASKLAGSPEAHRAARPGGPGRPPRHDWERFQMAMFKRVYENGMPNTQAELVREMQDWCDAQLTAGGSPPDESTIRRKVQIFWREFHG